MKNLVWIWVMLLMSMHGFGQVKNEKRGIAYGHHAEKDLETISNSLSWWYNWSTLPESGVADVFEDYGVDFIPMVWNANYNAASLDSFYNNHPNAYYLLGFNEPNFISQANMTPSKVADEWPKLEALANKYNLEIVSPAVNWCGNCVSENGVTFTDPYEYLDSFFAACVDCQVDYIAVHSYMSYPGALVDYLEGFKKYGKKIWLTEFAAWDGPSDLAQQKSLMLGALDYLDNDTMIFRYSWFIGRAGLDSPPISIYDKAPGSLTELGELYLNYNSIHDRTVYFSVPDRIEAESYSTMSGISIEGTSDFDGLANVGWIDAGDWLEYNIDVADSGDYYVYLRLASITSTNIQVFIEDTLATTLNVQSTGGWQNWETFKSRISLNKGKTNLKLLAPVGNFNINWFRISAKNNLFSPSCSAGENQDIILPIDSVLLSGLATDADGDDLIYKWEMIYGPSDANIVSVNSISTAINNLVPGKYTFSFSVSDGFEVISDNVVITVLDENTIASVTENEGLELYPNPIRNELYIKFNAGVEFAKLKVYNSTGRIVLEKSINLTKGETIVNLGNVEKGLYVVMLENNKKVHKYRIVKLSE